MPTSWYSVKVAWGEKAEIARRIGAARVLKGWDQKDLDRECADAHLRKDLGGALERGEVQWSHLNIHEQRTFADLLSVPMEWFTAEVSRLQTVAGLPVYRENAKGPPVRRPPAR